MRLIAEPECGLIDTPVIWRVEGVPAGALVRLSVFGIDAEERAWLSEADYPVGADGTVQLDDADRPWWSMQLVDRRTPPVAFTAPEGTWKCVSQVRWSGRSAQATLRRIHRSAVSQITLVGQRWRLQVYLPRDAVRPAAGVLLIPGSTGMASMVPTAALLASRTGYCTAVLDYLQQPAFQAIPVEVFGEATAAFAELDAVDIGWIAVWVASMGTAFVLTALAGRDAPPVRGVISVSPTDVVWQARSVGEAPPQASSLTRDGADIPWLGMHGELPRGHVLRGAVASYLSGRERSKALRLLPAYQRARRNADALARATIPVEGITAPMLLIAGEADAVWPSAAMATSIAARRRERGVGGQDQLLTLPGAGHFCRPPATPTTVDRDVELIFGGTPEGNARAQRQAWNAELAFLQDVLGPATT